MVHIGNNFCQYQLNQMMDAQLKQASESGSGYTQALNLDEVGKARGYVRKGTQGDSVRDVQQQLSDLGYDVPVSGKFDAATDKAVRAFQSDNGLSIDGLVGPNTVEQLESCKGCGDAGNGDCMETSAPAGQQDRALDPDLGKEKAPGDTYWNQATQSFVTVPQDGTAVARDPAMAMQAEEAAEAAQATDTAETTEAAEATTAVASDCSGKAHENAVALHESMEAFVWDGDAFANTLSKMDNEEIHQMKDAYQKMYGEPIEERVKTVGHGEWENTAVEMLKGNRNEGAAATENGAMQDATALYEAMDGVGTTDSTLQSILTNRSKDQLAAIEKVWERQYAGQGSLREFIEGDTSGDYETLLVSMLPSSHE